MPDTDTAAPPAAEQLRNARRTWETRIHEADEAGAELAELVHQLLDEHDAKQLAAWLGDSVSVSLVRGWDRKHHRTAGIERNHKKHK